MNSAQARNRRVVVVGQICRDLVCLVPEIPVVGTSVDIRSKREMLGGKRANQAVAMSQLGLSVALISAGRDDEVGKRVLSDLR